MGWRKLKLLLMRKSKLVKYTLLLEDVILSRVDKIVESIEKLDRDTLFIKADTEKEAEKLEATLNIIKGRVKRPIKIMVITKDSESR